jgi:ADP-ribose pyrophosphatase YjhB (NUDIX family)
MATEDTEYRFCPRCAKALGPKVVKAGEPPRPACAACGFVLYLNPKVAACTICTVEGGIVLLKRAIAPEKGKWVFPGGFVDRGEPVAAAAIRETREEVNLRVGLTGILDVYSFPGQEVAVVVYAAHVLSGRLLAGDETEAVRAFPPEELPWDDLGFDTTRAALRDYLRRFYPRVRAPRQP